MLRNEYRVATRAEVADGARGVGGQPRTHHWAACQPHENDPRARSAVMPHDPAEPQSAVFRECRAARWLLLQEHLDHSFAFLSTEVFGQLHLARAPIHG